MNEWRDWDVKLQRMKNKRRKQAKETLVAHGFKQAVDLLRVVYDYSIIDALYVVGEIQNQIKREKAGE